MSGSCHHHDAPTTARLRRILVVVLIVNAAMFGVEITGTLPGFELMGAVGFAALAANVFCALLLIRFREGDSNMRSVWLCSRNDAISNVAVMIAAAAVFASETGWPDIAVAVVMASLALTASWQVVRHALSELRGGEPAVVNRSA